MNIRAALATPKATPFTNAARMSNPTNRSELLEYAAKNRCSAVNDATVRIDKTTSLTIRPASILTDAFSPSTSCPACSLSLSWPPPRTMITRRLTMMMPGSSTKSESASCQGPKMNVNRRRVMMQVAIRNRACSEPPVRASTSVTFSDRNVVNSEAELLSWSKNPISWRKKERMPWLRILLVRRAPEMPNELESSTKQAMMPPQRAITIPESTSKSDSVWCGFS
mmetsp:Transcript_19677/g.49147  ORF Transcript_19677/g.49147 Transcript_19677/m.49147 type:complete len:224 (-) Transcript_19677:204-875(-)